METSNDTGVSAAAIAAATAAGAQAGDESRELAHVDDAAAKARAAELIKLSIPKLTTALAELSLVELRALLVAEEAEGEGKTRTGALDAIGEAIDKHPDQVAALAQGAPPVNEQGGEGTAAETAATMSEAAGEGPADGGPVDLELADDTLAEDVPASAADVIASTVAGLAPEDVERLRATAAELGFAVVQIDDESADWDNAEVLAHVLEAGAIILIARRDFPHNELQPIHAAPAQFERAHDGQRVLFAGDIELSGLGLASPLPLEEAWLVFPTEDGPVIVRRCEVPGALYLEPGRVVAFRPRTLIF